MVYYFRLEKEQREEYVKQMAEFDNKFLEHLDAEIVKVCQAFKPAIPSGVALNTALQENLFLLFLCVMTRVPLVLVGKPGSSKTLAITILRDALSNATNVRNLGARTGFAVKQIHIVSFQCSAQSKAEGIKKRWEQALNHQKRDENVIVTLLLDEIGLAEHSKYRPLKVLHQLLENPVLSFVGLSNWSLGLYI